MVNIVWFQFDLRINDHLPLFDASSAGSIIPLFIYDEKIWEGNDRSNRHRKFLFESLVDLDNELKNRPVFGFNSKLKSFTPNAMRRFSNN